MRHCDKNQILTDKQHGFRARLSCETQLISTIQETANNMTQKGQTDVILHKFAKAFHRILHKLNYYGVEESTLCWIESFLSSSFSKGSNLSCWMEPDLHKQMYCLKARKSRGQMAVPCGTLLFLVFINDLPESTIHSDARLFTDDCLLYRHVTSSQDQALLQEDLSELERWEETWQIKFHPDKCTVIRISTSKKQILETKLQYSWQYIVGSRQQQVLGCHYQRGPQLEETH